MRARRVPKLQRITFDYDGENVKLQYNTKNVVSAYEGLKSAIAGDDADQKRQAFVRFVGAVVTDWNITDEDDRPLPINEETLEDFTADFLFAIAEQIGADFKNLADRLAKGRR